MSTKNLRNALRNKQKSRADNMPRQEIPLKVLHGFTTTHCMMQIQPAPPNGTLAMTGTQYEAMIIEMQKVLQQFKEQPR